MVGTRRREGVSAPDSGFSDASYYKTHLPVPLSVHREADGRPDSRPGSAAGLSPEERGSARTSAQYWKWFNQARVQRMRASGPSHRHLDSIAGCLAYLRLPLEPMCHIEIAVRLSMHATELAHALTKWYAPKIRYGETFMFSRMPQDMQFDLLQREENYAQQALFEARVGPAASMRGSKCHPQPPPPVGAERSRRARSEPDCLSE